MALLTIEEILNHRFTETKFREGFDQEEVDTFLDRVIHTIAMLQDENADLKTKLEEAERRLAEVGEGAAPVVAEEQPEAAPVEETQPVAQEENVQQPEAVAAVAPVAAAPVASATAEPESATSMLALAQRVHDEYVRDGREEGDRIISESREKATEIVKGAEDERTRILADLEEKRGGLENHIEELKSFERDYRAQMRTHLEGLLGKLEQGSEEN
ncbi:DivIVA domain-containing protein [Actinomycetaceae bacterium TAE3-ERU4]|nr:DivIVA domain-containing protein [Actinomycetaceae bacterium TAE3-ERU4]